jgi:SAM-dependent methyltransferase
MGGEKVEIRETIPENRIYRRRYANMSHRNPQGREYVHGRSARESERLGDQARTLEALLHEGTRYPPGCVVLEAACGVGAQTVILAANNPETAFVSIDISASSLQQAKVRVKQEGCTNVRFELADIYNLPFPGETFDHVFVCFLLEHLPDPVLALNLLKEVLKPGGSITVIEGDHGSAFFHPDSVAARLTIQTLIKLQKEMKGNALIGRQLYPLLKDAGFYDIRVSPRTAYVDGRSTPEQREGFKKTFIWMVEGVRDQALAAGLIDEITWEKGILDLYRTAGPRGTFCYTFFKGTAVK